MEILLFSIVLSIFFTRKQYECVSMPIDIFIIDF